MWRTGYTPSQILILQFISSKESVLEFRSLLHKLIDMRILLQILPTNKQGPEQKWSVPVNQGSSLNTEFYFTTQQPESEPVSVLSLSVLCPLKCFLIHSHFSGAIINWKLFALLFYDFKKINQKLIS